MAPDAEALRPANFSRLLAVTREKLDCCRDPHRYFVLAVLLGCLEGEARDRAEYESLVRLMAGLEAALDRGTIHVRNRSGRLLTSLDQVMLALLHDDLWGCPQGPPAATGRG